VNTMRRWAVAAASALVLAAIVTTVGCGGSDGGRPRTDTRALWRLQLRIEHDAGYLARRGVFFKYAGQGANRQGACVYVGLANPTAPNVAFVRRRFGGPLCIGHVGGPFNGCAEVWIRPGPQRRRVPDLLGLGVVAAQDRARGAGFPVALSCSNVASARLQPSRWTPEYLARVTAQCPKPGTRASPRIPIALEATAVLPGGFTYTLSGFDGPPRCGATAPR
jgi:hypothetical protein